MFDTLAHSSRWTKACAARVRVCVWSDSCGDRAWVWDLPSSGLLMLFPVGNSPVVASPTRVDSRGTGACAGPLWLGLVGAMCIKDLEERPSSISFGNLAQATLTQVVLFKQKKARGSLKNGAPGFRSELNPDIMMCPSELEKKLAKHFDRVEIHGKRSRMVPVLLTPDMIAAMNLLVKNRNKCQVHTDNIYLFARPGVLSHYRGSDCFRRYASQCGAKYPAALTLTRLRKQVATLSTVLNLKEN